MEFELFNPQKHKFTYHPEATPKFYLSNDALEDSLKATRAECETEKDFDTLEYINTMERTHFEYCQTRISSIERRNIIENKKEWFKKKHNDKPQHANSIYDRFYSIVNEGRW
jgi:hypothetical protein